MTEKTPMRNFFDLVEVHKGQLKATHTQDDHGFNHKIVFDFGESRAEFVKNNEKYHVTVNHQQQEIDKDAFFLITDSYSVANKI